MTVGLMIYEDHLENLVVSKIYIFQEIITLGSLEDLGSSNIMILRMLLMQNTTWMGKFFLAGKLLLYLLRRTERNHLR